MDSRFLPRGGVGSLRHASSNRSPRSPHQPPHPTKPKPHSRASMEVETADEKKGATGAAPRKKGASGGVGLEWELERQYDAFEREMMLMAAAPGSEHQKLRRRPFAADLLQNCDLPPPAKLFGPLPTLQRLENAAETEQKGAGSGGNDSLLRALRLSQSRAREAEGKLAAAGASNGDLAALLVRDSVVLSAHRRWVMMLEAENSVLRGGAVGAEPDEEEDGAGAARHGVAAWWVALAVCVGIAGAGLALGKLLF